MSIIETENLGMRFRLASEDSTNLKEYIIQRLKKKITYTSFDALKDITVNIEKGENIGVIGVNGAGKSTFLKLIAGVLKPTSGSIKVDGVVAPLLELGSGFDPELTGKENVYLNGSLLGYSKRFIDDKYDEIVAFAELEKFMNQKINKYSSGMTARLAFSIATARETPDILLLDEILGVGDMFFRKKSEAKMKEMIKGGSTVFLVSHSLDVIKNNCTKVIWLEKGQVKMFGDVQEVCECYKNKSSI